MICGLVLAGGRSSRFGREKAMAELAGRPLVAWAAEALAAGVGAFAVSAQEGSGAATYALERGWAMLTDAAGGSDGPLAGIAAGLRWAVIVGATEMCTAPCDAPFLPGDLVARLAAGASGGAAVARTSAGLEPLCALWPVGALAAVEGWSGRAAPRDVLAGLGAAPVDFPDADAFANLNTPQDFAAATTRLR